ncbi:putative gibberellin regulated protein [Helianthus annuus]|nr:putative gibberellin regulated protein [Helianthus annuus]
MIELIKGRLDQSRLKKIFLLDADYECFKFIFFMCTFRDTTSFVPEVWYHSQELHFIVHNDDVRYYALMHYHYLYPTDCKPRCTYRCSATSHKKPCMFFCQKCCAKCLCVPAGVYGNKQSCACYNKWKTQQGKPKCP